MGVCVCEGVCRVGCAGVYVCVCQGCMCWGLCECVHVREPMLHVLMGVCVPGLHGCV
jgi:hypothetical protein